MLLISRLTISVILVVTSLNVSANSYDEIWKLLLKNKREEALTQLQKIKKSNNAIEGLLLENLIKSQLGQFEFNNDLISEGLKKGKEFEYILNAFQNQSIFFGDYRSDGIFTLYFTFSNQNIINFIYESK